MPQREPPSPPRRQTPFIDPRSGELTTHGLQMLDELWRQIAAGHVIIPCQATTAANVITLAPKMHEEGARAYGDHMTFAAVADATTTGAVTAMVASPSRTLSTIKVYKDGGSTQAGNNDIILNRLYLFIYNSALDSAAGGFVLK